jgi:Cdc6-like AAA superfamily ATPase
MKFFETHFEDYLSTHDASPLHPKLLSLFKQFPTDVKDFRNIIIYGPKGVGKYTQALSAIRRYSNTDLKYEKKLVNETSKGPQLLKISDIHFEVDMSLLGCNSKALWNDIYTDILDVVSARPNRSGIIMCKYFHEIHGELLDSFYSFMQTSPNQSLNIKFVFISEELSFIPDNIRNRCLVVRVPRPTRAQYNRCLTTKVSRDIPLSDITNMKNVMAGVRQLMKPYQVICDNIVELILDMDRIKFTELRDRLYDIFIYHLDVTDCMFYILEKLVMTMSQEDFSDVMTRTHETLRLYNNNYRPIYHLERFVFYLVTKIHGLSMGV